MSKKNKTDKETSDENLKKFCDTSAWPAALGSRPYDHEEVKRKARCDFRMPKAECIDNAGPFPRWAIYCSCGTTIFGNTKMQCEDTWKRHVEEKT